MARASGSSEAAAEIGTLIDANIDSLSAEWLASTKADTSYAVKSVDRSKILRALAHSLGTGEFSSLELAAADLGRSVWQNGGNIRDIMSDVLAARAPILRLIRRLRKRRMDIDGMLVPHLERFLSASIESFAEQTREQLVRQATSRTVRAEQTAARLKKLALAVTRAEQRERRRNAEVVHDHLQQLLVAGRLLLGNVQTDGSRADVHTTFTRVDEILNESIDVCRNLAVELVPPVLLESTLADALRWLASWVGRTHGLQVQLELDDDADPMEEEIRVYLYQAVRELLFNVVKHSGVMTASLRLVRCGDEALEIVVRDDGQGFDLAAAQGRFGSESFGIAGIRHRMQMFGGSFQIETAELSGVLATLKTPLSVEVDAGPDATNSQ